ncbi:MAG: alpha/beta fold hydrolase [Chloroflexi bacterium]|nr:alpha/beta fold hydrolase [Chloroflexota bacterium]
MMTKSSFRFRGESRVLDAEARSGVSGEFVQLPDGMTHYEITGPPDGQTVVLVHGFSVPYFIWDPTFDALAEAGFRVLRYDLYGRGYSDRPDVAYDQDLFDRQLVNLLSALDVALPIDLIGLSMGGPITVTFADRRPAQVRKLGLIDPAGFITRTPFFFKLMQIAPLGEWLMSLFGDRMLLSGLADDFHDLEKLAAYRAKYLPPMKYVGFKRALLSTIRYGILGDVSETFRRVSKQKRPTLLIWGREDQTVPFDHSERVRAAIPHIEFHAIDGAGHIPHYEQPELINPLLIKFLRPIS